MARMISNHIILPALIGLVALLAPQPAQADDSHQARVLYQKGNNAFKSGDSILARDYYRKSLALEESFDTLCNLGRAEAQDKLFTDAYEHLAYCVALYPEDEELAGARARFLELKNDVRGRLSSEQVHAIDEAVVAEMKRREEPQELDSGIEEDGVEPADDGAEKKSSARLPVVMGVGSLGVVGLGVGVGFLADAGSKRSAADDIRQALLDDEVDCSADGAPAGCSDLAEKTQARDSSLNVATVGLVAGGALVVGAVVTYLVWPKPKKESEQARLLPTVALGRDRVGFALSGSF